MRKLTNKEKLAYLAGIVDGDGHLYVAKMKKKDRKRVYYYPRVVVVQKTPELIDWLKENFGGCKVISRRHKYQLNDLWVWSLTGKKVTELAKKMQPFLITKKEQVKRVL